MASESLQVARDQSRELTVELIGLEVAEIMADAPEGDPLDPATAAIIALAVRCSGTTLDMDGTREHIQKALAAGITGEQIGEMMYMISGMGIHGLIGTATILAEELKADGHPAMQGPFDDEQQARWDRVGGGDAREARIAAVSPEFLPNMVRLVPEPMLKALLDFRAAPWYSKTMTPLQMELIGCAVDTMESHRFLPTLRMHVNRAKEFGAGKRMMAETLAISAAAPGHRGVW